MSPDPSQLMLKTCTSFKSAFFLLRVPIIINGQPATIGCSEGMLTLNSHSHPSLSITFDALFTDVSAVVRKHGIAHITNNWCEDVPLFELKFSTPAEMKRFVRSAEKVQNELEAIISAKLAEKQGASDPSSIHPIPPVVVVPTEVFLLTPDYAKNDSDLVLVTSDNLSTCLTLWKKSEVFMIDFRARFRAYRTRQTDKHGMNFFCNCW